MTIRLFSLVFVLSTAGAFLACAQVQQPTATQPRVASKKLPFYSTEILGAKYKSDHILLEHPSNPASMRRTRAVSPFVQVAGGDDIPTQHLFDDETKGLQQPAAPANEAVPPPPGMEDNSITPITEQSESRASEGTLEPIPEPNETTTQTSEATSTVSDPVVITEPVVVSNVGDSVTVTANPAVVVQPEYRNGAAFQAGPNYSYVEVNLNSAAVVSALMGTGCSN